MANGPRQISNEEQDEEEDYDQEDSHWGELCGRVFTIGARTFPVPSERRCTTVCSVVVVHQGPPLSIQGPRLAILKYQGSDPTQPYPTFVVRQRTKGTFLMAFGLVQLFSHRNGEQSLPERRQPCPPSGASMVVREVQGAGKWKETVP